MNTESSRIPLDVADVSKRIQIWCGLCGCDLGTAKAYIDRAFNVTFEITPCADCLRVAKEAGIEEGKHAL